MTASVNETYFESWCCIVCRNQSSSRGGVGRFHAFRIRRWFRDGIEVSKPATPAIPAGGPGERLFALQHLAYPPFCVDSCEMDRPSRLLTLPWRCKHAFRLARTLCGYWSRASGCRCALIKGVICEPMVVGLGRVSRVCLHRPAIHIIARPCPGTGLLGRVGWLCPGIVVLGEAL